METITIIIMLTTINVIISLFENRFGGENSNFGNLL